MACRHARCAPEGDDESEVKRIPHDLVTNSAFGKWRLVRPTSQVIIDLLHTEETEMIN